MLGLQSAHLPFPTMFKQAFFWLAATYLKQVGGASLIAYSYTDTIQRQQ